MTIVSANASTDITGKTGDYTVTNGENLLGTANGLRIVVPDGYSVYFFNCNITGGTTGGKAEGAAVYCKGNATIYVYNDRHAQFKSGNANCAAIYVPEGKTLDLIDNEYGSMAQYLSEQLFITHDDIKLLRKRYLQ